MHNDVSLSMHICGTKYGYNCLNVFKPDFQAIEIVASAWRLYLGKETNLKMAHGPILTYIHILLLALFAKVVISDQQVLTQNEGGFGAIREA